MKILSWLQNLFDDTPPAFKPRPPRWNKTLADLSAEKRSLSGEEIEWARDYEREQLRGWARFPRDGELFEAAHEVRVSYLIDWRAPYSTGGEGVLPPGTRIKVTLHAGETEPIMVHAVALDEKAVAERLIPEDDRSSTKYGGYSLTIGVAQLNKEFRHIESEAAGGE